MLVHVCCVCFVYVFLLTLTFYLMTTALYLYILESSVLHFHPSIHPSIFYPCMFLSLGQSIPAVIGQRHGTHLTYRQLIAGPHRDKIICTRIHTMDNLEFWIDLTWMFLDCWRSQRTRRKPIQTQGEHADYTQKCPRPRIQPNSLLRGSSANRFACFVF